MPTNPPNIFISTNVQNVHQHTHYYSFQQIFKISTNLPTILTPQFFKMPTNIPTIIYFNNCSKCPPTYPLSLCHKVSEWSSTYPLLSISTNVQNVHQHTHCYYAIFATCLISLQRRAVLMTDEGSAYLTVTAYFGWNHVLDRYHFKNQIKSSWQNIKDPY